MTTFEEYREKFRDLYEEMKKLHQTPECQHRCHPGHGLEHDAVVMAIGILIAPDKRTAEKTFCAAATHSMDYLIPKEKVPSETTRVIQSKVGHLFEKPELEEIITASLRHKELNQEDQSPTQRSLMDSDRLGGLILSTLLSLPKCALGLPTLEFEYLSEMNPTTTYRDPKSNLDNVRTHLAYIPMLRMPKAIALGNEYAAHLSAFFRHNAAQYVELGLHGVRL
jgi:hypothetical protein